MAAAFGCFPEMKILRISIMKLMIRVREKLHMRCFIFYKITRFENPDPLDPVIFEVVNKLREKNPYR